MNLYTPEVIVIGGGNIGSAVAYGLSRHGATVALLDEGDIAFRSARGNFGLVWFSFKGLGMPRYVDWCLEAVQRWPAFSKELEDLTGISLNYEKPGGLEMCLSQSAYQPLMQELESLKKQTTGYEYECEFIDRKELQSMIPKMKLGPEVQGATYCPHDGHVNPLYLLRALHAGFQAGGGGYFPAHKVSGISREGGNFVVQTPRGRFSAPKLVLAAGLGIPPLAGQLGMDIPVQPVRGQILVTEKVAPSLPYPMGAMRQTAEGCFMFGVSKEHVGFDNSITTKVIRDIARRAVNTFPCLADLKIVRSWGALRPLTPDGTPIYEESQTQPGAFVFTSHSGVSLASVYTEVMPSWILNGQKPDGFAAFHSRRFNVQAD